MKKIAMTRIVLTLLASGVFLCFFSSFGGAAPVEVDCNSGGKIQAAVDNAGTTPNVIINVTGVCNENVIIREHKHRFTLDGKGTASINGNIENPDFPQTLLIFGPGTVVTGFTITGGLDGIEVGKSGTAKIDGNTIQNTGRFGISVFQNGSAVIINNTVQNNPSHGILVDESSSARIGFEAFYEPDASSNTIQYNGGSGIVIARASSAVIVGNVIRNNVQDGVTVARASHADISANTIDENGQNGILVTHNSGINLGNDTGTGIFDSPNKTTLSELNGDRGLKCTIGAYMDGRRGTLKGIHGAYLIATGCTNSTLP